MSKREEVKDLERAAFATAYVEHGFNGKRAALAIKPHLTSSSAEYAASDYLSDPKVVSRVSAITDQCREEIFAIIRRAAQSIEDKELQSEDPAIRGMGHKYLNEYGKIFAPDSRTPKTAIQNNNYKFPRKTS